MDGGGLVTVPELEGLVTGGTVAAAPADAVDDEGVAAATAA